MRLTSSVESSGAEYYPHALARASDADLRSLREGLLAIAERLGFPQPLKRSDKVAFDQLAGSFLHSKMSIVTADAASPDTWNFINTRVVPELVLWRHGTWNERKSEWEISDARLYKRPRTAFGRLWWRHELLGGELASQLPEDASVNLMEKPRIGGYKPLARCMAREFIRTRGNVPDADQMFFFRDATKRLVREMAVRSVFAMQETALEEFVEKIFEDSLQALSFHTTELP